MIMRAGPADAVATRADPFDADYARALCETVLGPINQHWFRPVLVGGERLPSRGPLIIAANHSGNSLPHDAIALDSFLWARDGLDPRLKLRTVFEPALTFSWWLRPCGVDDFYRRGGGVDLTFDNFEQLLLRGDRVLYFPEGVPGIGKGFQNRYRLQRFHRSFILLGARHDVPVVPIYVINGEWVMPFHFTLKPVDFVMQRVFRVPFLPLPAGILACIFPFLWFIALPAQLTFVVGTPLDVRAALAAEGVDDPDEATPRQLGAAAERIRQTMQRELDALVAEHGKRPYDWRSLWRQMRRAGRKLWRISMLGWPGTYLRFDRDRRRAPARNRLHAIVRDWDVALFYLPFGWPLLSLARAFRKPPYGYRGLTRAQKREQQGTYLWRLRERPLPERESRERAVVAREEGGGRREALVAWHASASAPAAHSPGR